MSLDPNQIGEITTRAVQGWRKRRYGSTIQPLKSIPDTQAILGGVSRRTVLRLLDAHELVRVRVGARTFVDPTSIRDYIDRQTER